MCKKFKKNQQVAVLWDLMENIFCNNDNITLYMEPLLCICYVFILFSFLLKKKYVLTFKVDLGQDFCIY